MLHLLNVASEPRTFAQLPCRLCSVANRTARRTLHLLRRKACIGTPDGLLPPPIDGRVCVPTMELRLGQFPTDGGRGDGRKKKLHRNQINIRCSENCLLDPQGPHRSFSGGKRNSKKRRNVRLRRIVQPKGVRHQGGSER